MPAFVHVQDPECTPHTRDLSSCLPSAAVQDPECALNMQLDVSACPFNSSDAASPCYNGDCHMNYLSLRCRANVTAYCKANLTAGEPMKAGCTPPPSLPLTCVLLVSV